MFSGIATLRDLFLYIIPGNLTVYLLVKILSDGYQINLIPNFSTNVNNLALLLTFASFSTLIGVIQSGFIILCFNEYLYRYKKNSLVLKNLPVYKIIGAQLTKKIRKTFELDETIEIEQNHNIFLIVNAFLGLRTNPHTYWYAERLIAFSHIYCAMTIPIIFGFFYLFTKLQFTITNTILLSLLLSGFTAYYCFFQAYGYRKDWTDLTYKLFYSLPEDKSDTPSKNDKQ